MGGQIYIKSIMSLLLIWIYTLQIHCIYCHGPPSVLILYTEKKSIWSKTPTVCWLTSTNFDQLFVLSVHAKDHGFIGDPTPLACDNTYSLSRNTHLITPERDKGWTCGISFRGLLDPKKWFLTKIGCTLHHARQYRKPHIQCRLKQWREHHIYVRNHFLWSRWLLY